MAMNRRMPLFCLPYAGGTTTAFRGLENSLGPAVSYFPYELPGRGFRAGDPPAPTVDAMVDDVVGAIEAERGGEEKRPYFLFGHSMGARLAYLAAVRMQALGRLEPRVLFLGGEGPPEISPWPSEATQMDRPERFRAEVVGSGAYPEELLRVGDKAAEILPVVRADLAAFDDFNPGRLPKLTCDVTVIVTTRDIVKREEAERWARRTEGKFEIKTITGSHFFFLKQMPALGKALNESIRHHI